MTLPPREWVFSALDASLDVFHPMCNCDLFLFVVGASYFFAELRYFLFIFLFLSFYSPSTVFVLIIFCNIVFFKRRMVKFFAPNVVYMKAVRFTRVWCMCAAAADWSNSIDQSKKLVQNKRLSKGMEFMLYAMVWTDDTSVNQENWWKQSAKWQCCGTFCTKFFANSGLCV